MFNVLFVLLFRHVVVPVTVIWMASNTFLDPKISFLGVNLIHTFIVAVIVLWQAISVVPNLALIRTYKVLRYIVSIIIEITCIIAFWFIYLAQYPV